MNDRKKLNKIFDEIFREEIFQNNLGSLYLACYVAIIAIPSFAFVDYFMYPEHLQTLLIIRVITTAPIIVILILAKTNRIFQNYAKPLGFLIILISASGIAAMIHITEGYQSPYYAGLVLANLVLFTFLILPLRTTIILSSITYALYIIPILINSDIKLLSIFVNNNVFLISMIVFAILGARTREELQFNELKSRYKLQKSNDDLEILTQSLAESNDKLLEHDRLKTEFFTNISHELRTPLTLIMSPLSAIIEEKQGKVSDAVKETLKMMRSNGIRLLKQINNLLDFAKLEAGKMRLKLKEVEPTDFCKQIVASVEHMAASRGLKLSYECRTKDGTSVVMDPEQYEKVVINLLHNAIKFTDEGGRITLCLDDGDGYVELSVEDTGVGIPKEMLETIFERFAQVDGSSTRRREGTGLGLSLAKEIVELHGGTIRAESEPEKGSRFVVKIRKGKRHFDEKVIDRRKAEKPVTYKKRSSDKEELKVSEVVSDYHKLQLIDLEQQSEPAFSQVRVGSHDHTIMAVDDNPDILKLMRFLLDDEFDLICCSSGREGLKKLREFNPDLVLCDVMMPEMDGYAFCKEMKSDPDLAHIPIILVTARAGAEMLVKGIDSGADDYLPKPFDSMELKARIRSLLRIKKMESELAMSNQNFKIRTDDLVKRQEALFHSLIKSLVYTIDAKDEYTRNHSIRVTEYSLAIAGMMGLTEREKKTIELASILHDVGKIGVPESILMKADSPSEEEWAYIKSHPAKGESIVKHIVELREIAAIVRSHHEKYDGSGYPDGLTKLDIPLGARIMAVADAYDAITSNRPYRPSLSHNHAVKEILKNSGKQFDPEVVDHFLKLAEQIKTIKDGGSDKKLNGLDQKYLFDLA